MGEEHLRDLLPGYALQSLDEDERKQVEQHLERCAQCREELLSYESVVDLMPLASLQYDPPPGLKARILHQAEVGASAAPLREPERLSAMEAIYAFFRRAAPAISIASLVLAVAMLVWNVLLLNEIRGNQSLLPALQVINMESTENAPFAQAVIVVSNNGESGTLVVEEMPQLPPDQQYQLWLIRDGERDSGGTFSVKEEGYASLWIYSHDPLSEYASFGVTIEPWGGSEGPTGPRVLAGSW